MATREVKYVYSAEDRTGAAVASVKRGVASVSEVASAAGLSLAALGGSVTLAGLFTMVKGINDSVDALNDLKDATGASIENISGLEDVARRNGHSFDTVGQSLIKFNQALGSTLKPGSDAERVLKAIGLNAQQLRDMDPAEALRQTAVALNQFADDGNKARATQELFGKSLREVAPLLKDLAEAGELQAKVTTQQAEEAEKFNKELLKLSANATDLGRAVANPLVTGMNQLIAHFRDAAKEGENLWVTLTKIGSKLPLPVMRLQGMALDAMGMGGQRNGYQEARREIETIQSSLRTDTSLSPSERQAMAGRITALQGTMAGYMKGVEKSAGSLEEAFFMGKSPNLRNTINVPPEEKAEKHKKAVKENTEAEKEWALYIQFRRKQFLDAHDAQVKALADHDKANANTMAAEAEHDQRAIIAIEDRIAALQSEMAGYGKLQSEIERTKLARMQEEFEHKAEYSGIDRALEARIEAQKRLIDTLRSKELRDANVTAANDTSAAWAQVGQSLTDSLMRGGKSAAQYLKDLFRTLVLQPILKPIGSMVQGAIGSVLGGGGQGGGILGGLSSVFGGFDIGGAMSSMSMGGGVLSSISNFASTGLANLAGTGLDGMLAANGAFGTAGGMAGMLGTAMPIIGGIALIAALASKMKGETRSGGQYNFGNLIAAPSGGELKEGGAAAGATAEAINAMLRAVGSSSQLTNFMTGLEKSEKGKGFAYAGGTLSTGAAFGQGWGAAFATEGYNNRRGNMTAEEAVSAFTEELKQATLQALQAATDVPESIARLVRDKDFDAVATTELDSTLAAVQAVITSVDQFRAAVVLLPFDNLKDLSFDLASALGDAAGGMDKLLTGLSNYYSNFFSAEEQRVQVAKNLQAALQGAGVDISADQILGSNRTQFREFTEFWGQRASTGDEYAMKLYATLLNISGAFAQLHPEVQAVEETLADTIDTVTDTTDAMADYNDRLRDQADGLRDTINNMQGFADSLKRFRMDLSTGPLAMLSPEAQYNATKGEFNRLAALAPNNMERLSSIEGAGRAYLDASKNYNGPTMRYFTDLAAVKGAVEASEGAALTAVQLAQMQLNVLQQQLNALQGIQQNTASTAVAVGGATTGGAAWGGSPTVGAGGAGSGSGGAVFGGTATVPTSGGASWGGSATVTTASATASGSGGFVGLAGSAYGGGAVSGGGGASFGGATVIPAYADGGMAHGFAWVGERGRELAYFPQPARVYSAEQSRGMVATGGGGDPRVAMLLERLVEIVAAYAVRDTATGDALVAALGGVRRRDEVMATAKPPQRERSTA